MYPHNVVWVHKLWGYGLVGQGEVPGQQVVDPADGVVCDAFRDVVEVDLRVEAVEFGGAEQRVHGCGAFSSRV